MQLLGVMATASASGSLFAERSNTATILDSFGPWQSLFNGQDLTGWSFFQENNGTQDKNAAIHVENGEIQVLGPKYKGGNYAYFGHLATTKEYSNYHFKLEFKYGEKRFEPRLLAKRNSGVLYHMFPQKDRVWPNSVELQLQESNVGDAIMINSRCWPGHDIAVTPAWPNQIHSLPRPTFPQPEEPRRELERQRVEKNGNFEKLGEWNVIEVIAIGDKAAHLVNGRVVTSLYEMVAQDVDDRNKYSALTSGRIGIEIESAETYFRNIQIRTLK
jgi:hypothetical protein